MCDSGRVTYQKVEWYASACLKAPRKQSRGSVMPWGCTGFGEVGYLVEILGNIHWYSYINIFPQHFLAPAGDIFGCLNPNVAFQQDNTPPIYNVLVFHEEEFNYLYGRGTTSWLLLAWLLVLPDHQHPWLVIMQIGRSCYMFHKEEFQLPVL